MTIEAVIFDWAGTTIDYGSRAPLLAFQQTFAQYDVQLDVADIRRDMGLDKQQHIRQLLRDASVVEKLAERFHHAPDDATVAHIFKDFKATLQTILPQNARLKPGIAPLIDFLEANGIPYGTTSGYDADMIAQLLPLVAEQGYQPKVNVTSGDTNGVGRPKPDMNQLAMAKLGVHDPARVLIVGDTVNDVLAAQAAGANAVGIIEGANLLAYSEDQWAAMPEAEKHRAKQQVRAQYTNAGADVIVESAFDLLALIRQECDLEAAL